MHLSLDISYNTAVRVTWTIHIPKPRQWYGKCNSSLIAKLFRA